VEAGKAAVVGGQATVVAERWSFSPTAEKVTVKGFRVGGK
jgi:hypothetical protein